MTDLTATDLIIQQQRRDAAARDARRSRINREVVRRDGLRIQLSAIAGVTTGDSAKVLANPYRFQCPPLDGFGYTVGKSYARYTNYKGQEFGNPAGKTLTPITFRTVIVEWGSFVIERDYDVQAHVKKLERLAQDDTVFRFLATHQYNDEPEFDMDAVMESVTITEQAGEPDARYVDLTITEWVDPVTSKNGRKRRAGGRKYPFTIDLHKDGSYDVERGASFNTHQKPLTFALISTYAYGKPSLASHVAANQKPPVKDFGNHTDLLKYPRFKNGHKIVVPKPPRTDGSVKPSGVRAG